MVSSSYIFEILMYNCIFLYFAYEIYSLCIVYIIQEVWQNLWQNLENTMPKVALVKRET